MAFKRLPGYNRLNLGANPLAYMGVNPQTPPDSIVEDRQPTVNDVDFPIGTFWVIRGPTQELWMLVNLDESGADWIQLYPGAGSGASQFPTDNGTANEVGGVLNIFSSAGSVIFTEGSGNTVSIGIQDALEGQILMGTGAASDPAFGDLISSDGTITIDTSTIGQIDITTAGAGGFVWEEIIADQMAEVNKGYICNKVGTLALQLPEFSVVGDVIRVTGINNDTGWSLTQGAGQQVHFGILSTTVGAGGSIDCTKTRDSIELVCVAVDTEWNVISSIGFLTVI